MPQDILLRAANLPVRSKGLRGVLAGGVIALAMGVPGPVDAQAVAEEKAGRDSRLALGAGAAYLPRYEGADRYRYRALPLIDYRRGDFFIGGQGIGYNFSPAKSWQFGPVLSYRAPRHEDASAHLRGLGGISGGADVGVFARWTMQPFSISATVKRSLGGAATGTQVGLGAGYGLRLGSSDQLSLGVSVDWADRHIMQACFGVDAMQSLRSGLPVHAVGSGLRRYGARVSWTHTFNRRWFSLASYSAYRLGSEIGDSPIVRQRNGHVISLMAGYRFW